MSTITAIAAFAVAAGLLTVTPGLDTVLVIRSRIVAGRRAAAAAAVGVGLGCLVWGLLVAVGLGAVLVAAPVAYDLLRWCGAGYLVWCGIAMLVRPRATIATEQRNAPASPFAFLWRGLLTNLLNPKVGLFYLSFLPQFVPAGVPAGGFMVVLTLLHVGMGLAWFALLISSLGLTARAMSGRTGRWLDRVAGTLFIAFGAKLAFERL